MSNPKFVQKKNICFAKHNTMWGSILCDHVGWYSGLNQQEIWINNIFVSLFGCVILDIDLFHKSICVRINAGTVCEFTHLMRKHVACDLVGNNVRIVCEDIVHNGAVILSWNKIKKKKNQKREEQQSYSPLLPQAQSSSPLEVKEYLM